MFFKSNQADSIAAAFDEYKRKTIKRDSSPSVLEQLRKFREVAKTIPVPSRHREKHREGYRLGLHEATTHDKNNFNSDGLYNENSESIEVVSI